MDANSRSGVGQPGKDVAVAGALETQTGKNGAVAWSWDWERNRSTSPEAASGGPGFLYRVCHAKFFTYKMIEFIFEFGKG